MKPGYRYVGTDKPFPDGWMITVTDETFYFHPVDRMGEQFRTSMESLVEMGYYRREPAEPHEASGNLASTRRMLEVVTRERNYLNQRYHEQREALQSIVTMYTSAARPNIHLMYEVAKKALEEE